MCVCLDSAGMLVPNPENHGGVGPGRYRDGDQPWEGIPSAFYPTLFKEPDNQERSTNVQG